MENGYAIANPMELRVPMCTQPNFIGTRQRKSKTTSTKPISNADIAAQLISRDAAFGMGLAEYQEDLSAKTA